jgi:hypothetical protein
VPLDRLDAATKSALTVFYEERKSGEVVKRVRQTPRHLALAALWRRYDQFQKLQAQVLGSCAQGAEVAAPAAMAREPAALPMNDYEVLRMQRRGEGAGNGEAAGAMREGPHVATIEASPERVPVAAASTLAKETAGEAAIDAVMDAAIDETGEPMSAAAIDATAASSATAMEAARMPVDATAAPSQAPAATPQAPIAHAVPRPPLPPVKPARAKTALTGWIAQHAQSLATHVQEKRTRAAQARAEKARMDALKEKQREKEKRAAREREERDKREREAKAKQGKAKDEYDFRKDPGWMWGGRRAPTPEPEIKPSLLRHLLNLKRDEQRQELLGKHVKLRAGETVPTGNRDPGYNPPWARRDRPQYAIGAGEFEWSE